MNPNRTAAPPVPVPRGAASSGDGIVVGTGPVDVEAYIDFQCPFCKQFELAAAAIMDKLLKDRIVHFTAATGRRHILRGDRATAARAVRRAQPRTGAVVPGDRSKID